MSCYSKLAIFYPHVVLLHMFVFLSAFLKFTIFCNVNWANR